VALGMRRAGDVAGCMRAELLLDEAFGIRGHAEYDTR
jgi:hypothetical protein